RLRRADERSPLSHRGLAGQSAEGGWRRSVERLARSIPRRRVHGRGCKRAKALSVEAVRRALVEGTSLAPTWFMAKYSKKAQSQVRRALHERKRGTLRSGRSGQKVRSREQAIAIGLSEARRAGAKVPRKRNG